MRAAMSWYYVLDENHKAVPATLMEWARFIDGNNRVAAWERGPVSVSTVFLGLDHSFGGPVPLIFETLVFGGPLDGEMKRHSTWAEAEAGHAEMVKRAETAHDCPQDRECRDCREVVCVDCAGKYEPDYDVSPDGHHRETSLVRCKDCEAERKRT